ncbi:MAG: SDR family NAD(P)-dependent oxidoreductase [Halioglobus sp.]
MSESKVTALVTGASAGLGLEFCRQLATRCDVLIAVARRRERLEQLADELSGQVETHVLEADLGTIEGVAKVMEALRQKGPVDILVNNAGFSTVGKFADLDIDGQRDMLSLHCDATMTLCRAAIPFMRERGSGSIINVSSLSAFIPAKGLATYAATKVFLNHFSQALNAELFGSGVEVQALCPGYIHTEFHDGMAELGFDKSRVPQEMWSSPKEVVTASLRALGSGQVLVVPGDNNRALARAGIENLLAQLGES